MQTLTAKFWVADQNTHQSWQSYTRKLSERDDSSQGLSLSLSFSLSVLCSLTNYFASALRNGLWLQNDKERIDPVLLV